MEGREVFKLAIHKMVNSVIDNFKKANLDISSLKYLVPHQEYNHKILTPRKRKFYLMF